MGGHVVAALQGVEVVSLVLRDEVVEDGGHVVTHVGVGILIDAKTATGMLDEEVQQAAFG